MRFSTLSLAAVTAVSTAEAQGGVALQALSNFYTLTAYVPGKCHSKLDGLKVNNLALYKAKVGQYCPTSVYNQGLCPNGTEQAFSGLLTPTVLVPGGQDLYVESNGRVAITVQHSHSKPPDAYWNYQGWNWTALPFSEPSPYRCNASDPFYKCSPPSGYWNFMAPGASVGGVMACPNQYDNETLAIYAVTPAFNRTDCTMLKGLGTHNYTGPNPPVWAY